MPLGAPVPRPSAIGAILPAAWLWVRDFPSLDPDPQMPHARAQAWGRPGRGRRRGRKVLMPLEYASPLAEHAWGRGASGSSRAAACAVRRQALHRRDSMNDAALTPSCAATCHLPAPRRSPRPLGGRAHGAACRRSGSPPTARSAWRLLANASNRAPWWRGAVSPSPPQVGASAGPAGRDAGARIHSRTGRVPRSWGNRRLG